MDILREPFEAPQTADRPFNERYARNLNEVFVSDDIVPDMPGIHGSDARTSQFA